MPEVREREKELRFTRSGQAVVFWIAAAVCGMAGLVVWLVSFHRMENPQLPHGGWSIVPVVMAFGSARLAVWLTRHAYVILTPIGMDVFPFFRPAKGMQTVFWSEIHAVEVDAGKKRLTLHFNGEKTAGIHLSLRPMDGRRRELFIRAVEGRVAKGSRS